jgi:hypothetical protein
VAGIASLVWSAHRDLTGPEVRRILTDTAMKNLPNGDGVNLFTGKDYYYGHGLVNADLAVRRAVALAADERLVNIDQDPRTQLVLAEPLMPSPTLQQHAEFDRLIAPSMSEASPTDSQPSSRNDLTRSDAPIAQRWQHDWAIHETATPMVGHAKTRVKIDELLERSSRKDHEQHVDEFFSLLDKEKLLASK